MNISLHLTSAGLSVALSGLCKRRHPSLASLWTISNRLISSLSRVPAPGPCCSAGDTENTYLRPQSHAMRLQHRQAVSSLSHWEFDSPYHRLHSGETEDGPGSPEGLVSSRSTQPVRRKALKSEDSETVLPEGRERTWLFFSLSLCLTHIARVGATRKHLAVPPIPNRKYHNLQKMGERPAWGLGGQVTDGFADCVYCLNIILVHKWFIRSCASTCHPANIMSVNEK